ncbi:hypothetical protein TNCV_4157501 [Trichonephila clavipes]|nr:hypothetical protein TNCV_4157501 [Trichonephila clavipes]
MASGSTSLACLDTVHGLGPITKFVTLDWSETNLNFAKASSESYVSGRHEDERKQRKFLRKLGFNNQSPKSRSVTYWSDKRLLKSSKKKSALPETSDSNRSSNIVKN